MYFEFNVVNPDNQSNKGSTYALISKICLYILAFVVLLLFILLPWQNDFWQILYNILIILMSTLPPIGGFFLFKKLSSNFFDFDYFIIDDKFRIVKISNRIKRKAVTEFSLSDIIQIGLTDSPSFEKLKDSTKKKLNCSCDRYAENCLYFFTNINGEKTLIICNYNDKFLTALHKFLKRESAFDKSVYKK